MIESADIVPKKITSEEKIQQLKSNGYLGYKVIIVRKDWKTFEVLATNENQKSISSKAEDVKQAYNELIMIIEGVKQHENIL